MQVKRLIDRNQLEEEKEEDVTRFNLFPYNVDVVIAVRSGLLMPEPQSVQELMLYRAQSVAV